MKHRYDAGIGYSSLEDVAPEKLMKTVRLNKRIINAYYVPNKNDKILVAGAGYGLEAIMIKNEFGLKTYAVDLNIDESLLAQEENLIFRKDDLMNLLFPDDFFSLVYNIHVLEHVKDHSRVLNELHRVLKKNGVLYIGFPNKNRLVGYFGASQKVSLVDMVRWNLLDYKKRMGGRFENKYGAHAGYSQLGFIKDALKFFRKIYPVRNQYMMQKYEPYKGLLELLIKLKVEEYIFPSNYFICIK